MTISDYKEKCELHIFQTYFLFIIIENVVSKSALLYIWKLNRLKNIKHFGTTYCIIWMWNLAIGAKDKSRRTSAEVKFMSRTVKYTRRDYKTTEDILSALTVHPVVMKTENYINKRIQHVRQMDRDRMPHLIWNINHLGNAAKDDPSKDDRTVRSKALQAIWCWLQWWWFDNIWAISFPRFL